MSKHLSPEVTSVKKSKPLSNWQHYLRLFRYITKESDKIFSTSLGEFFYSGRSYHLPKLVFVGPSSGGELIRLGIFAGWEGQEHQNIRVVAEILRLLEAEPALAKGYEISFYPILNPTGLETGSARLRSGKKIWEEVGKGSDEPEIYYLEQELAQKNFNGLIYLANPQAGTSLSAEVRGGNINVDILQPALDEAYTFLTRSLKSTKEKITTLSHSPWRRTRSTQILPFEVKLNLPDQEPFLVQVISTVFTVKILLEKYREFLAIQPNL